MPRHGLPCCRLTISFFPSVRRTPHTHTSLVWQPQQHSMCCPFPYDRIHLWAEEKFGRARKNTHRHSWLLTLPSLPSPLHYRLIHGTSFCLQAGNVTEYERHKDSLPRFSLRHHICMLSRSYSLLPLFWLSFSLISHLFVVWFLTPLVMFCSLFCCKGIFFLFSFQHSPCLPPLFSWRQEGWGSSKMHMKCTRTEGWTDDTLSAMNIYHMHPRVN